MPSWDDFPICITPWVWVLRREMHSKQVFFYIQERPSMNRLYATLFLLIIFPVMISCKPSQEEFTSLQEKVSSLGQRVDSLEERLDHKKQLDEIIEVDSFTVRLTDKHHIKLSLSLKLQPQSETDKILPRLSKFRDMTIMELGSLSSNDFLTKTQKNMLRDKLLQNANKIFDDQINELYFTELLLQ
jgi:flagellar basal body-associated protein FliL